MAMGIRKELLKEVKHLANSQVKEPEAKRSIENEFFLIFANHQGILFEAEVRRSQIMKKGESEEEFLKRYQGDDEKRVDVRIALRNLLNRFITDRMLKKSKELNYFVNLFLKEPENPIRYDVSKGKLEPIYDKDPDNLGWCKALKNSLQSFLMAGRPVKNIKKCPYCGIYFMAKDAKKQYCYSNQCFREHKRKHKRHQREVDPGNYV
jgi:hypothetical protein